VVSPTSLITNKPRGKYIRGKGKMGAVYSGEEGERGEKPNQFFE